jgi:hypothetical protein
MRDMGYLQRAKWRRLKVRAGARILKRLMQTTKGLEHVRDLFEES